MTAEQARDLETRLRDAGLSRRAAGRALAVYRAWIEEHPAPPKGGEVIDGQDGGLGVVAEPDHEIEIVEAVARALLRDVARGTRA